MRVYVLHMDSPGLLTRAFDRILASSRVASCMVEPEQLRVRFLAPSEHADTLVERIYAEGGMRWCSRHDVASGGEALTAPLKPLRLVGPADALRV